MVMTTRGRKAKGRGLQQLTRDRIIKYFPDLSANDVRSTSMGAQGVDIQLSDHAKLVLPLSIECKARASFDTLYGFMIQAETNTTKDTIASVVLKANRQSPLIMFKLDDFLDLLSQLHGDYKYNKGTLHDGNTKATRTSNS